MAKKSLNGVLHHVRILAALQTDRALGDPELLQRFVERHDEAAFTVLIERHGPMVLGVCRRALQHAQDAEDACQATFLVFARKAGSIRKKASLGSWLHGIACRVAANLRRQRIRRQKREQRAAAPAATGETALHWHEVQTVLDEELQHLPERLRAPLLLCYWEGKTRDEAAEQLGVSAGKLHGILERGRALLRGRLTQRGLTLSAALCASFVAAGPARAALTPTLVVSATKAGLAIAAGESLSPSQVSSQVLALTKEVLTSMFLTKLKIASVSVLCVGLAAALACGAFATPGSAQNPPAQGKPADPQAKSESDEAFIRRISKDLRGVEPTPAEVHFFVHNQDADKRQKLIDLFIQERQARQQADTAVDVRFRVSTLSELTMHALQLQKLINEEDVAPKAKEIEARRAQLEAQLKQIQADLDALKEKQAAAKESAKTRETTARALLWLARQTTKPSVIALQNTFFRSLVAAANEKQPAIAALQEYRDALLKYLDNHPKAADAPEAMLQIELTYRAQGKTVEADAWRAKLQKEHPGSPAAKHRVSMIEGTRALDLYGDDIRLFFSESTFQLSPETSKTPKSPPAK